MVLSYSCPKVSCVSLKSTKEGPGPARCWIQGILCLDTVMADFRAIMKKKQEREPCHHCLPSSLGKKKYKGSTQHVPRSMDQNKQCIVDAWKQHSSNMFGPQIRDPGDRQEWNKCEGQEFELAQREPFFFAHKCHAGATESIQWGPARDMQNQSLSQETLVLGAGKEGSSQWANCAAFLSGLTS